MTEPFAALRRILSRARPRVASIRTRQFWLTQVLVLLTVALIYLTHLVAGNSEPGSDRARFFSAILPVVSVFSLLPAVYAALAFGVEGAVLTTLWIAVLAAPHTFFGAQSPRSWIFEAAILITVLGTGGILALRVEREREARQRAEALSRRLALLHQLGLSLGRAGALPDLLEKFVRTLQEGIDAGYVSMSYRPEPGGDTLLVESGDRSLAKSITDGYASDPDPLRPYVDTCVVPLHAAQYSFGALGVAREGRPISMDEREVVAVASIEASASLEMRQLDARQREALTLYARQVTNAQEEERARIARELHDGVVQELTALVREIDLMRQEWSNADPALMASFEQLRSVSSDAVTELRRVTSDLRPATLDRLGLLAALRSLAAQLYERSGIRVDLHFGNPASLPAEVDLCIFRVVQEALRNVERHAQATVVRLVITSTDHMIRAEVTDDGVGGVPGDVTELARRGQFGLLGMTERAALVGGTIEMLTQPGETSLVLLVPLAQGQSN